jgi:diaminopimelate epimerase
MRYPFAKYQGLGNDFIVLDARHWPESMIDAKLARHLCDRHLSIGGDGILWVELRQDRSARLVIYNQDGSRPEMCGNGVRCVAAYFADRKELEPTQTLALLTDAGPRSIKLDGLESDGSWRSTIDMGIVHAEARAFTTVELSGQAREVYFADAGNPHAVLFIDDVADASPEQTKAREAAATAVRAHTDRFPKGTNVEFVGLHQDGSLRARVHERGVGWTRACGTGACAIAAVVAARQAKPHWLTSVELDGGRLSIRVTNTAPGSYHAWMSGPARRAFVGSIEPHELGAR